MNLRLAKKHIHNAVEAQDQIQEMHEQYETINEDTRGKLADEHDKQLEQIRLLVTEGKHLINETRGCPPIDATPSVSDSVRRNARVKLPTLEVIHFQGT